MSGYASDQELRAELERRQREAGGTSALARELGISRQMLNAVLRSGKPLGVAIPEALGYHPVTVYKRA